MYTLMLLYADSWTIETKSSLKEVNIAFRLLGGTDTARLTGLRAILAYDQRGKLFKHRGLKGKDGE